MERAGWNRLAQVSNQWQDPVNTLVKLRVPSKVRNFLFNLTIHGFPGTYFQAGNVGLLRKRSLQEGVRMVCGRHSTQVITMYKCIEILLHLKNAAFEVLSLRLFVEQEYMCVCVCVYMCVCVYIYTHIRTHILIETRGLYKSEVHHVTVFFSRTV
jgi:hypothetical protein